MCEFPSQASQCSEVLRLVSVQGPAYHLNRTSSCIEVPDLKA